MLSEHMRRCFLFAAVVPLIASLLLLRSYRFERVPDERPFALADLRQLDSDPDPGIEWTGDDGDPVLRMTASADAPAPSLKVAVPLNGNVEALHVRIRISAEGLVKGGREWESGRVLIRWIAPGGHGRDETDPLGSVEEDLKIDGETMVVRPSLAGASPVLCIENLGGKGELLVSGLEIIPVRERGSWLWGRWVVGLGWFAWLVVLMSGSPKVSFWRKSSAAAIWIVMGMTFAFPGPWKILKPLVIPYELGVAPGVSEKMSNDSSGRGAAPSGNAIKPLEKIEIPGKLPASESWIIQAKQRLKEIRILVHIGLVAACTLVFLVLVGVSRAVMLAGAFVIAMEMCQTGFGFGFDLKDVLDLASGAGGIFIAVRVYGVFRKWYDGVAVGGSSSGRRLQ